jgi:Cu/Ag efflux protein CusF
MRRLTKRYALVLPFGFFLLSLGACGSEPGNEPNSPSSTAHTYTVRGEVRGLPEADNPASSFRVRHEAIPEFVDPEGEARGMEAMTMPFPVEPEQIEGLAVGDPVEMTFQVDWEGSPALAVLEIRKLPPGTELSF